MLHYAGKIFHLRTPYINPYECDHFISMNEIYLGKENIAKLLIDNGAVVDAQKNGSYATLHLAAELGNFF